jgi:predicted AAA+ superfamily ATPase
MELLKGASKQVEGLYGTSHDPLAKLKALFGGGKT